MALGGGTTQMSLGRELATSVAASNQRRGPRTSTFRGWALATLGHLNHFNRPVRTRMPGGVGGARSAMIGPYPDGAPSMGAILEVEVLP